MNYDLKLLILTIIKSLQMKKNIIGKVQKRPFSSHFQGNFWDQIESEDAEFWLICYAKCSDQDYQDFVRN